MTRSRIAIAVLGLALVASNAWWLYGAPESRQASAAADKTPPPAKTAVPEPVVAPAVPAGDLCEQSAPVVQLGQAASEESEDEAGEERERFSESDFDSAKAS